MYHGMPKDVSPTHFLSKQTEPGLISLLAKAAIYSEKGKRYLVKNLKFDLGFLPFFNLFIYLFSFKFF